MNFILALLGLGSPATAPVQFTGNDFYDCTINGKPMNEGDVPIVFGDNNVAWPTGWTKEQAAVWRRSHGLTNDVVQP